MAPEVVVLSKCPLVGCACDARTLMWRSLLVGLGGWGGCIKAKWSRWLGSRYCFCLGCAESENLSLAEQLVVGAGLYKDIAFPKYKKAIGKLTFLFYQFSTFYISPPHAHPPNTQVLSDFRVGQWT